MDKNIILTISLLLAATAFPEAVPAADDKIELKTTTIKGNKELPKILYVVPWKDIKHSKQNEHKLELHSLFGNLFDPILPKRAQTKVQ